MQPGHDYILINNAFENLTVLISGLARWAFMHCMGSSLFFWFSTIINETVDTLLGKLTKEESGSHGLYETYNYMKISNGI